MSNAPTITLTDDGPHPVTTEEFGAACALVEIHSAQYPIDWSLCYICDRCKMHFPLRDDVEVRDVDKRKGICRECVR